MTTHSTTADLAPTTAYRYAWMIDHYLISRLGHVHLRRLRADHLDDLYTELLCAGGRDGKGLSPKTVLKVHVEELAEVVYRSGTRSTSTPSTPAGRQLVVCDLGFEVGNPGG